MNDPDTPLLPGPDRQGVLDRRYDVRIAARLATLTERIDALEARIAALEP
jgi:hypothetical protein